MPAGTSANVNLDKWTLPPIFAWLADVGPIEPDELLRTFNCGVGMAIIIPPGQVEGITAALNELGESVFEIGEVSGGSNSGVSYLGSLI